VRYESKFYTKIQTSLRKIFSGPFLCCGSLTEIQDHVYKDCREEKYVYLCVNCQWRPRLTILASDARFLVIWRTKENACHSAALTATLWEGESRFKWRFTIKRSRCWGITYIPRTADDSAVPVADAPLTLPIATARKHLAANQMPSDLQIFKTYDRKHKRHIEMTTYPDYTDILLHNGHFSSKFLKQKHPKMNYIFIITYVYHLILICCNPRRTLSQSKFGIFELLV